MIYIIIEAILIILLVNNVWVTIRNLAVQEGMVYPLISGIIAAAIFVLEKIQ